MWWTVTTCVFLVYFNDIVSVCFQRTLTSLSTCVFIVHSGIVNMCFQCDEHGPPMCFRCTLMGVLWPHSQRVFSAYFNDIVVGAVCCREDKSDQQRRLYIMTLGCLAPYRRHGIGMSSPCTIIYLSNIYQFTKNGVYLQFNFPWLQHSFIMLNMCLLTWMLLRSI